MRFSNPLKMALLGSLFAPSSFHPFVLAGSAEGEVRILAYNIRHGQGMDDSIDLKRVANLINAWKPDLVALQEIDEKTERTGRIDQAFLLADLTGLQPVFGPFMNYQGGRYGMAILSRFPIVESWNHPLPEGAEPRTALAVKVRLKPPGQELIFIGVHLYRTESERLCQARRLVDVALQQEVPVVLAGDFNSEPDSPVMQLLGRYWAIPPKGEAPFTFPADQPSSEIDYVLLRPGNRFEVLEHRVIDEPVASDHRPVFLKLRLLPSGE